MKAKAEELLYLMFWAMDRLANPTFRNLTDSFEAWAYRNGLLRELQELERRAYLETHTTGKDRVYRLTGQGRLHVLGGRDPQERWSRPWDTRWRMVVFDVPTAANAERARLRRFLAERGFGWLQRSVWVTPDPLTEELEMLRGGEINVGTLILLEAQPCSGESDSDIVAASWDFAEINGRYARCLQVLAEKPRGAPANEAGAKALQAWAAAERGAWLDAIWNDPLLPEALLPKTYLGREAWQRRVETLRETGKLIEGFKSPRRTDFL